MEPSIGHQAWDLLSLPFSLSLKGGFESLGALSFPGHNFQFILNTCSDKFLEEEKDD
jgi:hypothetical protein